MSMPDKLSSHLSRFRFSAMALTRSSSGELDAIRVFMNPRIVSYYSGSRLSLASFLLYYMAKRESILKDTTGSLSYSPTRVTTSLSSALTSPPLHIYSTPILHGLDPFSLLSPLSVDSYPLVQATAWPSSSRMMVMTDRLVHMPV
jgi:hypothetical protein